MKQYKVIIIGAGGRGKGYSDIMSQNPEQFKVVGVAEPIACRREYIKEKHGVEDKYIFDTWEKILDIPKFADLAVISTMDRMHTAPALKALELGYDLLLEKPAAPTPEECALIANKAKECGRKVMVCHVLRYTPFFMSIKKLIEDGVLGDIVSIDHVECVGNRHQSHSFVRGNWGNEEESSFMLLQKCCHDLDILQWLLDRDCEKIQSFGSLTHFKRENAPEGSPERCIEGCPVGDTCPYNAMKLYYEDKENHWFRAAAAKKPSGQETDEDVLAALRNTQYGKCVYKCNNNVVDHQTVNMEFEGSTTVSMTMSAFAIGSRTIRIMGTKGQLLGDMGKPADKALEFFDFSANESRYIDANYSVAGDSIVGGHGGGDNGIISALYDYLEGNLDESEVSGIGISCKNHMLAFAAEEARHKGCVIGMDEYVKKYM